MEFYQRMQVLIKFVEWGKDKNPENFKNSEKRGSEAC
jgi:hypothetical protein